MTIVIRSANAPRAFGGVARGRAATGLDGCPGGVGGYYYTLRDERPPPRLPLCYEWQTAAVVGGLVGA